MKVVIKNCAVCDAPVYAYDEEDITTREWKEGGTYCGDEDRYYCKDHQKDCCTQQWCEACGDSLSEGTDDDCWEDVEEETDAPDGVCVYEDAENEGCPEDIECEKCQYFLPNEPMWSDEADPDISLEDDE